MADDNDEFFDEFDELANTVANATHTLFPQTLRRWFAVLDEAPPLIRERVSELYRAVDYDELSKSVFGEGGSMEGSATIRLPDGRGERLGVQLQLFKRLADEILDVFDFAHDHFYASSNKIDDTIRELVDQLYLPFTNELRRDLKRNSTGRAPASDRTVSLSHNSQEYSELLGAIGNVETALREANDYDDPDDKEQRIAEVSAGRRLLEAPRVRLGALMTTLGAALIYLGQNFIETAVGKASEVAMDLLTRLIPAMASLLGFS